MMPGALLDFELLSFINRTSPHLRVWCTPLVGAHQAWADLHCHGVFFGGMLLQWQEGSAPAPALKRWQLRFVGLIFEMFAGYLSICPTKKRLHYNKAKVVWALWMPCNVALPRRNCCSSIHTNLLGSWKQLVSFIPSFQDLDDFGFEDMMPPTLPPPETLACKNWSRWLHYSILCQIQYTSWTDIVVISPVIDIWILNNE